MSGASQLSLYITYSTLKDEIISSFSVVLKDRNIGKQKAGESESQFIQLNECYYSLFAILDALPP